MHPKTGLDQALRRFPALVRACRVEVDSDGIYLIGSDDLASAGVNASAVDPRTFVLTFDGSEVPLYVYGEEDGVFDGTDYFEFFGEGNTGKYSSVNTYWLTWGSAWGARMDEIDCTPGDSLSVPAYFLSDLRLEDDLVYYPSVYRGFDKDHWFWSELFSPCTVERTVYVPGVASSTENAEIRVLFTGKTEYAHQVEVYLNRTALGTAAWTGMDEYEPVFQCSQRYIHKGDNIIKLVCTGSVMDQAFFNRMQIVYRRNFTAESGEMRFSDTFPGRNQFSLGGFRSALIEIFVITDRRNVKRVFGHEVTQNGEIFLVAFEEAIENGEYLAVDEAARRAPLSISVDEPSNLTSQSNHADYLIITHEDFYDAVQPLRQKRQGEGLDVKVVEIGDVYDEFNHGNKDPRAIRDFLAYAFFNWSRPVPSFVLLVGDASYDYRGNISGGNRDYMPAHLMVTESGYFETSSDDWYVCLNGEDLLQDMLIGRLVGQTPEDIDSQVAKIIQYEEDLDGQEWRKKIVLVADDPDDAGDFEGICDQFEQLYITPSGFEASKIYKSQCYPGCTEEISSAIEAGCVICNYVGHGSIDRWAREQIYVSPDIYSLTNQGKYPFVVSMTCLNGYFHNAIDDYSMGEEFVRCRDKGAVACFASSGLEYSLYSDMLGGFLYDALLFQGEYILGSAVCRAKTDFISLLWTWPDQAQTYILLGDPALETGFPARPDLLAGGISFDPSSPRINETDTITVSIYNAGREVARDVGVLLSAGHPDSVGSVIISESVLVEVPPGGNRTVSAAWTAPADTGDVFVFARIDPDSSIEESCEWNNEYGKIMHIRPHDAETDSIPPAVALYIDGKLAGDEFADDDFTGDSPDIKAVLTDGGSGIDMYGIAVTMNGNSVEDFLIEKGENADSLVEIGCYPKDLTDGRYTLSVSACDCEKSTNRTTAVIRFRVESATRIDFLSSYPNPGRGKASIVYSLSRDASRASIRIYDVAGRIVRVIEEATGTMNRNVVEWDGRDNDGRNVATGVYFCRITVSGEDKADSATKKLVLIR